MPEDKGRRSSAPRPAHWVRPKVARAAAPFGMTKLYELINAGRIRTKKVDGMRLVDLNSIDELQ